VRHEDRGGAERERERETGRERQTKTETDTGTETEAETGTGTETETLTDRDIQTDKSLLRILRNSTNPIKSESKPKIGRRQTIKPPCQAAWAGATLSMCPPGAP
jgi:hypothetical protein